MPTPLLAGLVVLVGLAALVLVAARLELRRRRATPTPRYEALPLRRE